MIREDAPETEDAPSMGIREVLARVEQATRDDPYVSVAAAVCVGFVLGGGLPSWAVRLLVTNGARLATAQWFDAMATPQEP